ncbi:MAG: HPr family phosphocarrier protein [Brevinematia bacterium]
MKRKTFVIKSKYGIHLRPANRIYEVIKKYKSKVEVKKEDNVVDARSLLGMITLNVLPGDKIEIIASGPDEDKVIEELTDLIENKNLGDREDD